MLTRRHFLQLLGVSAASISIDPFQLFSPRGGNIRMIQDAPRFVGRILTPTRLYESVNDLAAQNAPHLQLIPNKVYPIHAVNDDWLRLTSGFVSRRHVQPILVDDFNPPASTEVLSTGSAFTQWRSVAASSAVIYSYAHVTAPIITSVGHGGVMQVTDYLPSESPNAVSWYGVSDTSGRLLGWSQAHLWREFDNIASPLDSDRRVEIDLAALTLSAYQAEESILTAPIAANQAAVRGEYSIQARQLSDSTIVRDGIGRHGIPYQLRFSENRTISGAYWHNAFGDSSEMTDHGIQVPVYIARWLYHWLPDGASVIVY